MVYAYPHLSPIAALKPNPAVLLGNRIYWTVKEDGSNIGCYLDENDEVQLRSRNQEIASPQFYAILESTGYLDSIRESLLSAKEYGDTFVIFGELLTKGKSPTRIELHEKNEYIVFDIWSEKEQRFIDYSRVYQEAYHMGVPVANLLMVSRVTTLEHLYEVRDGILAHCKEIKKEGSVGKVYGNETIYFKEKLDSIHYDKVKTVEDTGKVQLPVLPDSEVYGAIEKVRTDIGDEQFAEVRVAMPLIAKYVGEECRKHHCSNVKNLHAYYKRRLEDIEME